MSTSAPASFIVAHRAGNDLERLRAAEALRLRLVEADVHLFAGRLEVRHRKTVGPLPILWDRWELAPPWAPRMVLDELLTAAGDGTELMLDLKGQDPRLPERVLGGDRHRPAATAAITVCSQDWRLLEPFAAQPEIRVVHSVGNARQLARGCAHAGRSTRRRLDPRAPARRAPSSQELRRRAALVLSWPVESVAQARRLAGWGVHGLISRSFENARRGAGLTHVWSSAESRSSPASPTSTPRLLAAALLLHVGNHGLRSLAWRNVLAAAYPDDPHPDPRSRERLRRRGGAQRGAAGPRRRCRQGRAGARRHRGVERGHDRLDDVASWCSSTSSPPRVLLLAVGATGVDPDRARARQRCRSIAAGVAAVALIARVRRA